MYAHHIQKEMDCLSQYKSNRIVDMKLKALIYCMFVLVQHLQFKSLFLYVKMGTRGIPQCTRSGLHCVKVVHLKNTAHFQDTVLEYF